MNITEWFLMLIGVFWLGVQTSICPCPLATNIAAVSYIGRRIERSREIVFSGFLYAFGQVCVYISLSVLALEFSVYTGDRITRFFTSSLHLILGPIMILIGMVLCGLLKFQPPGLDGERMKKTVDRFGLWSAFPLGAVFAFAFCPTTAAMFLGMLILSGKAGSIFWFPFVFGIGMSLPVVFFAVLLAFQVRWLGKAFNILEKLENRMRLFAGIVFILIGIVYTCSIFI